MDLEIPGISRFLDSLQIFSILLSQAAVPHIGRKLQIAPDKGFIDLFEVFSVSGKFCVLLNHPRESRGAFSQDLLLHCSW